MKKLLITLFMSTVSYGFALDDTLANFILANEEECVRSYECGKIYIHPDCILVTEEGLFLETDRTTVPIGNLQSDYDGCYVTNPYSDAIFNDCPGCGKKYFVICKNPFCPLKQNTNKEQKPKKDKKPKVVIAR